MVAPEVLLQELAGGDARIGGLIEATGPLLTPYDVLVHEDGWLLDPTSPNPTAPFDDPGLDPNQRIINAMLVACDYAVRRGADTLADVGAVLNRESPLAVRDTDPRLTTERAMARRIGISADSSLRRPLSFVRRDRAHAALTVPCDPVLSFQPRTLDWDMGDNALSSFVVHNEGERDGVEVTGEVSERWGVTVGLPRSTSFEELINIETEVALMPSFLPGISSWFDGQALEVGWAFGESPEIEHIGECIRVWTMTLFDLEMADVRIVFAPARGRSVLLTTMRSRARAFRLYRTAIVAGQSGARSAAAKPFFGPAAES